MSNYWKTQTQDGLWHFCHRTEDLRFDKIVSQVIEKQMKIKTKISIFMDDSIVMMVFLLSLFNPF